MAESGLISIIEAAARGIERLRKPVWAIPEDHLKIDILAGGAPGPWTHLFSPLNLGCSGRDPVDILCSQMDYQAAEWEPYTGLLADSAKYKNAQERFVRLERGEARL